MFKNKILLGLTIFSTGWCAAISPEMRAKGWVYLSEIDPTIQVSLRYFGSENFLGKPVDGYQKSVHCTIQAPPLSRHVFVFR